MLVFVFVVVGLVYDDGFVWFCGGGYDEFGIFIYWCICC